MSYGALYRRHLKKPLKVYWWRYDYPSKLNFGDELTPLLIERLFGLKTVWSAPDKCELVGAGSIIEVVQELSGKNKLNVWGSGFIQDGELNTNSNLKFLAVRGKKSLERINNPDVVLGDPGLLTALAYDGMNRTKRYKLGVIPHYVDAEAPKLKIFKEMTSTLIINPLWPLEKVVEAICSCELVLSSSLHGLIVSDSFNIPNYWMPLSDALTGGNYKFNDYYSVFNYKPQPILANALSNLDVDELIKEYQPRAELETIQKKLIVAFPY